MSLAYDDLMYPIKVSGYGRVRPPFLRSWFTEGLGLGGRYLGFRFQIGLARHVGDVDSRDDAASFAVEEHMVLQQLDDISAP
jgi:hypothetical protein